MIETQSQPENKARLAILATMGRLHADSPAYDLARLKDLVISLSPDLVCSEVTRQVWETRNLETTSLELREALAPLVNITDIVLVPVSPTSKQFEEFHASPGWRQGLQKKLDRFLKWGQRKAGSPEAIHSITFEAFCHTICFLTELTWQSEERAEWSRQNEEIASAILDLARQEPGSRILVAVQCQRLHRLEPILKKHAEELEIIQYQEL